MSVRGGLMVVTEEGGKRKEGRKEVEDRRSKGRGEKEENEREAVTFDRERILFGYCPILIEGKMMRAAVLSLLLLLSVPAEGGGSEEDVDSGGGDTGGPQRTRVVETKYGLVQGRLHRVEMAAEAQGDKRTEEVEIYQGIRYATPPVGTNR